MPSMSFIAAALANVPANTPTPIKSSRDVSDQADAAEGVGMKVPLETRRQGAINLGFAALGRIKPPMLWPERGNRRRYRV